MLRYKDKVMEKVYFNKNDTINYYFKVVPKESPRGITSFIARCRGNSDWELKASKIPYIAGQCTCYNFIAT